MPKKRSKQKANEKNEWPAIVFFCAFGLAIASYMVVEAVFHTTLPHPTHWVAGLFGGIVGIGVGWLWYRWRGDLF